MEIKPIKTEKDYKQALKRLETIFEAKIGSAEGDELEVLGILIDQYENEHFPIGLPDPIEAIKFRMEQMGYNQNDLANIVGLKSRASEILNRKRKLSLEMIRQLHERLNIPTDVLIQTYCNKAPWLTAVLRNGWFYFP
jgi:HTH-type transcriptional regulator/antitoxin HigA